MNLKKLKLLNAFTLAGGRSPLLCGDEGAQASPRLVKWGFTLAEVLITLGVIGVVAAVTMPTLVTNIQERVRKEQVRTVKYKFTKATEKMNSLGKIGHYDSTMDFVNELKKHLTIAKICDNEHLGECWGGAGFSNAKGDEYKVSDLKKGNTLDALQFNSGDMDTVGIVTGDGVPIILVYGKECEVLDETKQYTWSTVDGKPETNATAGCVSMVFDINGQKGPNKIGTDVRTMNSLLGMIDFHTATSLTKAECDDMREKLGLKYCYDGDDYYAGAVKVCHDLGLHLPSRATLAKIVSLHIGVDVGETGGIAVVSSQSECLSNYWVVNKGYKCLVKRGDYSSPLQNFSYHYFVMNSETTDTAVPVLYIGGASDFLWGGISRNYPVTPLCVGD